MDITDKTMQNLKISKSPSIYELLETLKQEFSNDYSYNLLDKGSEKTIKIRKSSLVRAHVSKKGDLISVEGTMPLSLKSLLFWIILTFGPPRFYTWVSPSLKFEKKLALFILNKYR